MKQRQNGWKLIVSRSNKKKPSKLFPSRQSKKRGALHNSVGMMALDIVCSLLPATLLGIAYFLLLFFDFFSIVYPLLHWLAFASLSSWLVLALVRSQAYWPSKLTYFFSGLFVLLTIFGSSWGYTESSIKMWDTPPAYTHLPPSQPVHIKGANSREILEGSYINLSWSDDEPVFQAQFIGDKAISIATEKADTLAIEVPRFDSPTLKSFILGRGLIRLGKVGMHIKPDNPPTIKIVEDIEVTNKKTIRLTYNASDDYGVEQVLARVAPSSSFTGGNTEPVEILLSTPGIKKFESSSYADLSFLEWSGLPVTIQVIAVDGRQQRGWSEPRIVTLPLRNFQNPFARTLIEERAKLNSEPIALIKEETANVMAGIARQQSLYQGDPLVVMALRAGAVRLILDGTQSSLKTTSDLLWNVAIRLEEGTIGKYRAALLESGLSLQYALLKGYTKENIKPFFAQTKIIAQKYMDAIGKVQTQDPPLIYEKEFSVGALGDFLDAEEIEKRFSLLEKQVETNDVEGAQTSLKNIQSNLEKVSSISPNHTPAQIKLFHKVSALKALIKGLKNLSENIENKFTPEAKKNGASPLDQQKILLSALKEFIILQHLDPDELGDCESLLIKAQQNLERNQTKEAKKLYEESIVLLEKQLKEYSEIIKQAIASKTSD